MLGHKRIPSREGGIEIVVEELATRMVTLGHKVTCYNRSGHHVSGKDFDGGKRKAYKGVRLKSVLTLDKKGLAAMTASVSGAICAAFGKYDVVHFHAEGPCAMLWLPKLFGKRCIATVHGLDHQRAKWGKLASTYIMMGEKCAVKFADEIIVLSKGVQDYFKETYGRETKFIPNGVNRPIIRRPELIKEKFGLEKDDYILFLGRLVPEKGIQVFYLLVFGFTIKKAILNILFPWENWWFITTYLILFVLSPYINKIIETLSDKEILKFVISFSFINLLQGYIFKGNLWGNGFSFAHAMNMYLIGIVLYKYREILREKNKNHIFYLIVYVICSVIMALLKIYFNLSYEYSG